MLNDADIFTGILQDYVPARMRDTSRRSSTSSEVPLFVAPMTRTPTRSRVGRSHAHADLSGLRIGARGLRSSWATSREIRPCRALCFPMDLVFVIIRPVARGPRNGRSHSNWLSFAVGVSAVVIFCLTWGFSGCTVIEPPPDFTHPTDCRRCDFQAISKAISGRCCR